MHGQQWAAASKFKSTIRGRLPPDSRRAWRSIGPAWSTPLTTPVDPSPDPSLPAATPGDFANPQDAAVLGWNHYRIEVQGNVIRVNLDGTDTAKYTNTQPARGQFSATQPTIIGLQSYSNYSFTTAFRNLQVTVL
jgi:hypothetical protein